MSKQPDWASEVGAWRASGKTASEFCKERGYSATRLYWWSSQLKRSKATPVHASVPLARVVRKRGASGGAERAPIVIEVGRARVEVRADADPAVLSLVLQSLASAPWGVAS